MNTMKYSGKDLSFELRSTGHVESSLYLKGLDKQSVDFRGHGFAKETPETSWVSLQAVAWGRRDGCKVQ